MLRSNYSTLPMPQSGPKADKTSPRPKNIGWSTWNPIEKGPKYTALAALHTKSPLSANYGGRHFWRLWTTFQKIPSYAPA